MADPGLVLEDVVSGYGEAVVLDRVSLRLSAGATLAVLGRNGVGKTTLMATVMGRTRLQSGRMSWRGVDLSHMPPWLRPRCGIGFVPQEREIFPSLTVEENLRIALHGGQWPLERIYELFPQLAQRRRNGGNELSGGEQQMLSIGRALAGSPALLLLDEPLEGLAPVIVDLLMERLDRLKQREGMAIMLVEQHARLALQFASDVIVLERGRIVHAGSSTALLADKERMATLLSVAQSAPV